MWRSAELQLACECLAKLPSLGHHVCEFKSLSIGVGHPEREHFAGEEGHGVPVGAPVACHRHPISRIAGLDFHGFDGACHGDVAHEHKVEVVVPVDHEPYAAPSHARNSARGESFLSRLPPYSARSKRVAEANQYAHTFCTRRG